MAVGRVGRSHGVDGSFVVQHASENEALFEPGAELYVGGERSMWSGDQECLMRYYDKQAYLSKAEPGRVRYLPDKAQWKARTRLCEDAKGTGVNAPGHPPQPRYGDAVAGKCRQQLVVNDKYAP